MCRKPQAEGLSLGANRGFRVQSGLRSFRAFCRKLLGAAPKKSPGQSSETSIASILKLHTLTINPNTNPEPLKKLPGPAC